MGQEGSAESPFHSATQQSKISPEVQPMTDGNIANYKDYQEFQKPMDALQAMPEEGVTIDRELEQLDLPNLFEIERNLVNVERNEGLQQEDHPSNTAPAIDVAKKMEEENAEKIMKLALQNPHDYSE